MNKKWQVYQVEDEKVEELQKKYKINKLLATILVNRGITEEKQIEKFLQPKRSDFYDPYGMPDMNIAVERIMQAIENKYYYRINKYKTNKDNKLYLDTSELIKILYKYGDLDTIYSKDIKELL